MLGSASTKRTRGLGGCTAPANVAAPARAFPSLNRQLPGPWPVADDGGGMTFSRSSIAAALTILALGLLAALALAAGGSEPAATTAPAPAAETDPPVGVRTNVIR